MKKIVFLLLSALLASVVLTVVSCQDSYSALRNELDQNRQVWNFGQSFQAFVACAALDVYNVSFFLVESFHVVGYVSEKLG